MPLPALLLAPVTAAGGGLATVTVLTAPVPGCAGRRPGARGNTAAARRVADDVRRWRACAAVLGPVVHADALRAQVTALVGQKPEVVNGVLLWRHL